jgi:tripartite-type tricarboxylate transporter receptor subunit TctC
MGEGVQSPRCLIFDRDAQNFALKFLCADCRFRGEAFLQLHEVTVLPGYHSSHSRNVPKAVAVAVAAVVLAAPMAHAQSVSDFYAGKTLSLQVGFSAGGGYDQYARALAQQLSKHIPGRPQVVVKNMPGAGSLKLAIYMHTVAPRDGTEIATIGRGVPFEDLLKGTKSNFDPIAQNWLGSMNAEASVCVVMARTGIKTLEDMRNKPISFGTQGRGSDSEQFARFVTNMFGLKSKIITGYPGTQESILAMERGEVDGNCGWSWTSALQQRGQWFKDGTAVNVFQFAFQRHPDLKDVPLLGEFAKNESEKAQVDLVVSRQVMGRPFLAPPGVPADRVAALRKAFMDTLADPDFKAFAEKSRMEINPVSGEEVQALVKRLINSPPEVIAAARKNLAE